MHSKELSTNCSSQIFSPNKVQEKRIVVIKKTRNKENCYRKRNNLEEIYKEKNISPNFLTKRRVSNENFLRRMSADVESLN